MLELITSKPQTMHSMLQGMDERQTLPNRARFSEMLQTSLGRDPKEGAQLALMTGESKSALPAEVLSLQGDAINMPLVAALPEFSGLYSQMNTVLQQGQQDPQDMQAQHGAEPPIFVASLPELMPQLSDGALQDQPVEALELTQSAVVEGVELFQIQPVDDLGLTQSMVMESVETSEVRPVEGLTVTQSPTVSDLEIMQSQPLAEDAVDQTMSAAATILPGLVKNSEEPQQSIEESLSNIEDLTGLELDADRGLTAEVAAHLVQPQKEMDEELSNTVAPPAEMDEELVLTTAAIPAETVSEKVSELGRAERVIDRTTELRQEVRAMKMTQASEQASQTSQLNKSGDDAGQQSRGQSSQQSFTNMGQVITQNMQTVREQQSERQFATVLNDRLQAQAAPAEERLDLSASSATERRAQLPVGLQSIGLPVNHQKWGQMLGQRVVYMANQQMQQAQITLNPEKLGPIQVRLHMDRDQQVHVVMTAQHGQTREAMEIAMPRLREMFEQAGMNLGSVDVNDQKQFADSEQQEAEQKQSASGSSDNLDEELVAESATTSIYETDNVVDYYA